MRSRSSFAEISAAYLCASLNIAPHGAPCRLYRFVARSAPRGQPRHRARRQRRFEGGGLHPRVPVRNIRGRPLQSRPTTDKGGRLIIPFRLPDFSRNAETDIRAPAFFPAFRVCGSARVREGCAGFVARLGRERGFRPPVTEKPTWRRPFRRSRSAPRAISPSTSWF